MSPLRSLPGRPAHPFFEQEFEHQLEMVRPATSAVQIPPVPEGYSLRQFRAGDEETYDDLFHLAFEDEGRFPETLDRVLKGGPHIGRHVDRRNRNSKMVEDILASSAKRQLESPLDERGQKECAHAMEKLGEMVGSEFSLLASLSVP